MKHYLNQKAREKSIISNSGSEGAGYMEDIVKEIGQALSQSQEKLDEILIESKQLRLKELISKPKLILPQASTFVLPEAKLDLNMQVKGKYDSVGNFKIETKPHNAQTQAKSNVSQEVSSKISLRFAMVPGEAATDAKVAKPRSKQLAEDIQENAIVEIDKYNKIRNDKIAYSGLTLEYIPDSRKWYVSVLDADEVFAILIFDDTTGKFLDLLLLSPEKRTIEDITELANPIISEVSKLRVSSGETVNIIGENLGALNMADTLITVGGKQVNPMEVSFEQITFKITPDLTSGIIKVTTQEGTSGYSDPLVINATPRRFEVNSNYGYFNPENKVGSLIKVLGENISSETKLKFTNGALGHLESHTPTVAQFRVPKDAKSGPVSFLTRDEEVVMNVEEIFHLRPFISKVSPKEARHNELVRINGNHFSNVTKIRIGERSFTLTNSTDEEDGIYSIKSDQSLLIAIPKNAGDGRMFLFSHQKWWDTNVFFYQVPSISEAPEYIIVGNPSKVYGFGFGKTHQGLYLEFEQNENSIIEASYLDRPEEHQVLGFVLRSGAYTDKMRIIRSDIASDDKYDETTTRWNRKIPVFRQGTFAEHILWCSPIWNGLNEKWTSDGFDISTKKVLKKREENGELSLIQDLPINFTCYGEFYNLDHLDVRLDILDDDKMHHGHLLISISPETITFHLSEQNANISYPTDIVTADNKFDRLFIKLHFGESEFTLSINEHQFGWMLNDQTSDVAVLLKTYVQLHKARKIHLTPTIDSFIGSVIISKYDVLELPSFSNFVWDFEIESLLEEEVGYELNEIDEFPSTEKRKFKITGSGFTKYSTVMINDVRVDTYFYSDTELEVDLHDTIHSNGELYVFDYLNPDLKSRSVPFRIIQAAEIFSSPEHVAAGETIIISGDHLTENGIPSIYVERFGPLHVTNITNELIEVIAPKLTIVNAKLRLVYNENTVKISPILINVSSLNNYSFLRNAHHAVWQVSNGETLPFGAESNVSDGYGSAELLENVTLDDGEIYEDALVITCPTDSEILHLEGKFEDFYLPNSCELSFEVGFLEEASQSNGIIFSVFMESAGTRHIFIDRAREEYGDPLSKYSFSYEGEGKKGTLVIRAEPGTSGFDDLLAIVKAELKFTHVEDGWTILFGTDKTNMLTIPGTRNETDSQSMPGSRSFSAIWQDLKGKIWLFGGYGNDANPRSGQLNDLWTYDGDNWTWVNGFFTTNGFSKFSSTPGEITTPGGRHGTAYWQDNNGIFWMFGGHGYHTSGRQRSLNDLWKFTEDEGWQMVAISEDWKADGAHGTYGEKLIMLDEHKNETTVKFWPLTRVRSAYWFDESTGLLWLFGGEYKESGKPSYWISDLWTFDGVSWELKNGDGSQNYTSDLQNKRPSARCGASIWTDDSGKLWLFGGFGMIDNQARSLNDLWYFQNNKWKLVKDNDLQLHDSFAQTNKRPGPRAYAALWKDSNGTVWMFGGEGSNTDASRDAPLNDLWKFEGNKWSCAGGPLEMRDLGNTTAPKIPYPDSWPSSRYGAACWLNPTGWLMMYGGKGYGESQTTGNKSLGRLQQMWQFSPGG